MTADARTPVERERDGALACLARYEANWRPRRDGCGFLCWFRNNEWQSMTHDEALAHLESGRRIGSR